MNPADIHLRRDAHGRLVFTDPTGQAHEDVVPVRAFPLSAPDDGIAIVSPDGHELAWIARPDALPEPSRQALAEALATRDFMPTILSIRSVSTFATPSLWQVDTDRGPTRLLLKSEDDIRRLADGRLLITSGEGLGFLVPDRLALDRHARKLLERFL